MSDKNFGVRKIELIGSSGTPNFTSPNNLNLNAVTVAISTDVTIGGKVQSDVIVGTGYSVGIGSTQPSSALTVKGNTSLETLSVSSVSTLTTTDFTGHITLKGTSGSSSLYVLDDNSATFGNGNDLTISHSSSNSVTKIREDGGNLEISANPIELQHSDSTKLETLGAGVTVTGTTFTNQLSVSGISTLNSNVSVGGTISVDGGVQLTTNNPTIVGTLGTVGEIKQIAGAPFYYDGSAWREFVLSSGTPVSVPADTDWDNVVFRATFDDDFTDAKFGATPVRVSAGATIVGAAVTIGTGAYRNIGGTTSGVGVAYTYRSEYDFTGSWTIEFWIYHDSTPSTFESLISQVSTIDNSGDWTFGMYNNGFNIYVYWSNENSGVNIRTLDADGISVWNTKYLDKWTHYALVRESGNGSLHFYINGTESSYTSSNSQIDNDILHIDGAELGFGAAFANTTINGTTWNSGYSIDAIFDDVRISCGVGTAGQRYNSIGIHTYATFTPPTTALPTTGTLSSYVQPPGDKYGEIVLGGSPTWRGTSGVTVSQQSSGNYRVSFASSYTNANDYYVLSQGMDQEFASYVGIARSTTHVDFTINKQSDDSAVDTGSLAIQIKNHI